MRSHWVFPFVLTAAACGGSGATHEPAAHTNPPAPEETSAEVPETSQPEESPAAPEAAPEAAAPEASE